MAVRPNVRVTQIGEYVRHHSCERRFKLEFDNRKIAKQLPFFGSLLSMMDPVLNAQGKQREVEWEASLRLAGLADLCRYDQRPDAEETAWELFADRAAGAEMGPGAYGHEIGVSGDLGAFHLSGRIDFALLLHDGDRVRLRLVECKASRKDRTYHRIQLALYKRLVTNLMQTQPLVYNGVTVRPEDIECVIARIDADTNQLHNIFALTPLDMEMEEADLARLLAPGGPLTRLLTEDLDAIPYQIDGKCDECALNIHCLPESARLRRIELLGVDPSTVRALASVGICSLDDLAAVEMNSPAAQQVRSDAGFNENLDVLRQKAQARRATLPGSSQNASEQVIPLTNTGKGQLPAHEIDGRRLVRIYLSIDYDYAENRIGAVAAHITASERPLSTVFKSVNGTYRPDPIVVEQWKVGEENGSPVFEQRDLQGEFIVGVIRQPWTGHYETDTHREARLLQDFFQKIVEAIHKVSQAASAPIHFYVWSRPEMTRLMEACARADTDLLGHLRQLLGCRESLEQLIYSVLEQEVRSRYALGWSGRGLSVVTALRWFGRRFHWTREIGGESVELDKVFRADIFDFQHTLWQYPDGTWAEADAPGATKGQFEARACFQDALPAPYWRAYWGTLEDPDAPEVKGSLKTALRRYQEAGKPGRLKAYLRARVQALRWVEEGIKFKNDEIVKPPLQIDTLPGFGLGVENAARAALDFLWLDQHVKVNDWIAGHLVPPAQRVPLGSTIPIKNVAAVGQNQITATIDLTGYPIDRAALANRCVFSEGSFVRLSPCAEDPNRGQSIKQLLNAGSTCIVKKLDWATGQIELDVMPRKTSDRYVLKSNGWWEAKEGYPRATLDDSVSDFVHGRVDARLQTDKGAYVYDWFDPIRPEIPPMAAPDRTVENGYRTLLTTLNLGKGPLAADQINAALQGLGARIQLLQGPPGTGKTQTTAAATLLRILHRRGPSDIVLVAANTHTAVDTLLARIATILPFFQQHNLLGPMLPAVNLAKLHSSLPGEPTGGSIHDLPAAPALSEVNALRENAVLIVGGTPSSLLKMTDELSKFQAFRDLPHGFQAPGLIVDEASMMVLPVFLALASLVQEDGEIMLAGDHRQLAPILAHDWLNEDRPPTIQYQPYVSAYEAVQNLKINLDLPDTEILRSALSYTFRLPAAIRDLIARLYRKDAIELAGQAALPNITACPPATDCWQTIWNGDTGLFLVTHSERISKSSNPLEAEIIAQIIAAGGNMSDGSIGVVMPHRAQRILVQERLAGFACVDVVDTVEKLQGNERETIIVSATASDPAAIAARAQFILSLNRSNVAFSRAKKRLVVVCAETLLSYIPPDAEHYEESLLWKSLRTLCTRRLATTSVGSCQIDIVTLPDGNNEISGMR